MLLSCNISVQAQNDLGKADDIGRIVLSPYIISNSSIPEYAAKVMKNKLTQIASKYGVAGNSLDQRFIITANLIELSKDFTPTAPPMIALTLSPTIYIGDAITGELYASCEVPGVKGVGQNETKAFLNAIKLINVNNPSVAQCIEEGKNKIIQFYNSQIDFLLAEAESLMASERYEEAMVKLAAVPNVCKDAYTKAVGKIGEIYQKKIDVEGDKLYNEAVAQWKTAKTKESAARVVELLAEINPLSAAAAKGRTLVKSVEAHYAEIAARRREIEERNWAFKMQQYQDAREDKKAEFDLKVQQYNDSHALRVQEQSDNHDYRMTKAGYDYEVQMEEARNGGKAMAAEYALQEVKNVLAMGRGGSSHTTTTTTTTASNLIDSATSAVSNFAAKVSSWLK